MKPLIYASVFTAIFITACGGQQSEMEKAEKASASVQGRVLEETIATGGKGFEKISGFRKKDITIDLCQHWEYGKNEGASSEELIMDDGQKEIRPQYNFFKDGSVLENPRHHARIGKWRIGGRDSLIMNFADGTQRWFIITSIDSKQMRLVTKNDAGKTLYLNLGGTALVHENIYNDPFHPSNNQWRIAPAAREGDSAIKYRIVNCIKFFALFYRDNLLRNKSVIDFGGFPQIFNWYSGGLGLPDSDKVDESWVECFYDKDDAMKGYKFLRKLIVDYEYNWPKKVDWSQQTHSVLEQMYHKALKM